MLTAFVRPFAGRASLRTVRSMVSPGWTRIVGATPVCPANSKVGFVVAGSSTTSSATRATPCTARTTGTAGKTSKLAGCAVAAGAASAHASAANAGSRIHASVIERRFACGAAISP